MRQFARAIVLGASAVGTIAAGTWAVAQGTPSPRPGLSLEQTKQAVEIARGAMVELRKKTEGASLPDVDRREYVVGVELLTTKEPAESKPADDEPAKAETGPSKEKAKAKVRPTAPGPLAVVTSYRYFDDITVFATVDLGTGKVVGLEAAQHLRTALSEEEYEDAKAMARERSDEVKALYRRFGDKISVYPQFSQYTAKSDPRVHRVVHLTYRVGTRDLSYPRPIVDLTTRRVTTPPPEAIPEPRRR
jgi:hypothetical protein